MLVDSRWLSIYWTVIFFQTGLWDFIIIIQFIHRLNLHKDCSISWVYQVKAPSLCCKLLCIDIEAHSVSTRVNPNCCVIYKLFSVYFTSLFFLSFFSHQDYHWSSNLHHNYHFQGHSPIYFFYRSERGGHRKGETPAALLRRFRSFPTATVCNSPGETTPGPVHVFVLLDEL